MLYVILYAYVLCGKQGDIINIVLMKTTALIQEALNVL